MKGDKIIAGNKKVYRDFEIIDTIEAGLELQGYEAQAARNGKVSLEGAYVKESNGELYVHNLFIQKNPSIHTSLSERRKRKLLMHKNEILRWATRVREKGLTILPVDMHINNNRIKLMLALAKKKKLYGKKRKAEERIFNEEKRRFEGA